MMNRLMIASTLALATATFTTGCDKGAALMSTLSEKASQLEHKLMDHLGPKARALFAPDGATPERATRGDDAAPRRGWQADRGPAVPGFDMDQVDPGELARMNPGYAPDLNAWAQDGQPYMPNVPQMQDGFAQDGQRFMPEMPQMQGDFDVE